jgi:NodT family efflux transporter outer membrane factor (OMF) lipoprotein
MRFATPAALTACLALAACATPREPVVNLPAAFEAPQGQAAADVLERWWLAFDDPELTRLVEDALAKNPDALTAAQRVREANAVRASALFRFLPQGDLTGSTRETHSTQLDGTAINIPGYSNSGVSTNSQANFNVSWEVDLFGRIFAAARAANADVAAVRFAAEGARASLAANVADAYFQARGLAIQLDDARATVRIQQEISRVATARAERGLGPTSDADRVAGDLAQARSQAAGLEAELQAARRSLLILSGAPIEPTASLEVPASVGKVPPMPAAIPSDVITRRPDVREAQARVTAAAGRLQVANLAFLPTINFTPGVGWAHTDQPATLAGQPNFTSTSRSWSIGGSVMQPILDIPRLIAELKAQDARTEQAVLAYEKAVQTAFGETENTLVRLDADRRRVEILEDGAQRARRSYEASLTRYKAGIDDLQTTLGAEQSWRAVRSQLAAAQVQALRRTVQSYKALGGGWPAQSYTKTAQAR